MTGTDETSPARRRVPLPGISSRAWEHPADRGALVALRELRGFDDVLKALSSLWSERGFRVEYLGGAIQVDHRQFARVHQVYAEAAMALDVPQLPDLFVQYDAAVNGQTIGMDTPFIVVTSAAVERLDDEELRCLFGHELGHALSGHALYRTMMNLLAGLTLRLSWLPMGAMALLAIQAALREWWRKAELSADRAGLLAAQDPSAALRLLMRLAGGGDLREIDTTAFLEQAGAYERSGDLRESIHKLRMVAGRTHPMPVARAAELRRWIDTGAYRRILEGHYPRRDEDANASMSAEARAAAKAYQDEFARSQDPLVALLRKVGTSASGLGDVLSGSTDRVRGWTSGLRVPGQSAGWPSSGGAADGGERGDTGSPGGGGPRP